MLATLEKVGYDANKVSSVREALEMHNLNWSVEVRPTYFRTSKGEYAGMKNSFATVRTDTEQMLGRVGSDYVPCDNAAALSHVDGLIASGAATLDSVFELKGGRRVGASLRLNDKISIAGEDPIEMYIVVTTSHDGTRADKTEITPIRLWCTNQLALISRETKQSWSVRHLSTMTNQLKVVEEELKLISNYGSWLQKTGDELVAKSLRENELARLTMDALNGITDNQEKKTKITNDILDVFKFSDLIGDDFKNTAWGGLNAVTEYFDHHRNYRSAHARYNSITNGNGARMRNAMAERLLAA
jgi:phage/plasmid-like protein (TIGR03299 family)